ncbi:MAG TPA: LPS assembly protein LptD [Acidobacteriaceae bacterium]|nr:LPS assembly protein LptD [Acidobacteriaceae bacterium]
MRTRLFWCITLFLLLQQRPWAQTVTTQLPPPATPPDATQKAPASTADLPDDPSLQSQLPEAHVVPQPQAGTPVKLVYDNATRESQAKGNLYTLDGNVVIYYRNYILHADHATYNDGTGEVEAQGHLMLDGGPDDEHFVADRGTINVNADTGDFFDVVGTLGVERTPRGRMVFTAPNPFAVTGREVQQLGQGHYRVIHGTMTSCRLPKPDWRILSHEIELNNGVAKTSNGFFEFFHVPLMYLPYATHAVTEARVSGFSIPYVGNNTTKGFMIGEAVFLTLGRSADMTVASQWWSKRGFAPSGIFRYRGRGANFGTLRVHSLLDKGVMEDNGQRGQNQGGVDVSGDGRYDLSPHTTAVVDSEYLSSYIYRLVFEEDYALAINSEVKSQLFVTHESNDMWTSLRFDRYQDFQNASVPGDEVRILHLPTIDFQTADRRLGGPMGLSPVWWGFSGSAGAVSRFDYPNFRTTASVERVDIHPRVSMPLHFDGWTFRPEAAVRGTWYGKSQFPANLEQIPIVRKAGLPRTDVEAGFDLLPPVVERDFSAPWLERLLGGQIRHTIEPELGYRFVTGINNFQQVLRFDDTDVASNTNELQYGVTQRLFLRRLHPHPCRGDEALGPDSMCGGGTEDWITWRVAQKQYFDPNFDHAITPGTPNPLSTTLDFTGIDFLTDARHSTPVISRLRVRTTGSTDVEWDVDYDAKEGKITSSNIFAGYRRGFYRFDFGDSYVNVPLGTTPLTTAKMPPGPPTAPNSFNQIHVSAIYGAANKLGGSAGVSAAYDLVHQQLQYGALQTQYNWNCCGVDFQYRRFSLGSIRDDTEYFYSVNFAGFASVGDLTHRISVF